MNESPIDSDETVAEDENKQSPRNPWQRWMDADTRKSAIDAKCWECCGGSETEFSGVREQIRGCTSGPNSVCPCPLYAWRPFK